MFPQTAAAMAAFTPLFEARHTKPPDRTAPFEEQWKWRRKQEASKAAQQAVVSSYARELLPLILGGASWRQTESAIRGRGDILCRFGRPIYSDYDVLFDHPLHFRRVGTTGMPSWDDAVIVGRPYHCFKDGRPLGEAVRYARHLAATHHVDVWARADLSAWSPGATALVIAGKDLSLSEDDAARFGFTHLAVQQ